MATATMSASTTSTSAPEIHPRHSLSSNSVATSPSLDAVLITSPRNVSPDALGLASTPNSADLSSGSIDGSVEPDPQILEALKSKDRLYVLKLSEQMESLINDQRPRIDLTPATSYQRLLVHRCSAYYKLVPESDNATKSISVYIQSESRIPARRISELVPAEESSQPAFKIMRRTTQDSAKSRNNSQAGSVAGEDPDSSDPSDAGSIGGRSNATGISAMKHLTFEEREAAYNEARTRIFMDFEAKEKDKDMSADSSTFSLVSGSGSTSGGRSSMGDLDDSASSVATESEWSGPVARDKREGRRGGAAGPSSRSMRHSNPSYSGNDSGSSRNSRATSPTLTYASLYEPAPSMDSAPYNAQPPHPGFGYYGYGMLPASAPGAPYGYQYYMSYGYPPPTSHVPEQSGSVLSESMYLPPPQGSSSVYMNPYMWPQPSPNQSVSHIPLAQSQSPGNSSMSFPTHPSHPSSPQPQNVPSSQYLPYMSPPQYNSYAIPYHAPSAPYPSGQYGAPPPLPGQQFYLPDVPNGGPGGFMNGMGNGESVTHSRASSRNSHGGGKRSGAPRTRSSWSYGPGAGNNGYTYNLNSMPGGMGGNDAVGPRLTSSIRRISGTSSGSGSTGTRTPGDEASSTASSSTSSSSRQTYTSTSSKHPLPARPDWAVGLKAQPGLHAPRHHDHNSNNSSRNMSPAQLGGHLPPQNQPQPSLQSTDFPPLSSAPERRPPVVAGAWTNASSTRSIMMSGSQGTANAQGTALVHYPNSQQQPMGQGAGAALQLDDQDTGFERPPPKANAELFNPKGNGRPMSNGGKVGQVDAKEGCKLDKARGKADGTGLAEKLGAISLQDAANEEGESSVAVTRPLSAVPFPTGAGGSDSPADPTTPPSSS